MAVRRTNQDLDRQLDLFTTRRPTHDTVDTIRPNGRETLARTLPEDDVRSGTQRDSATDAPGSGGEDEGRNGHAANGFDAAGINGATSARPGLGNGDGEIPPAPARRIAPRRDEPPKNLGSYRITETDRLGEGGPRQKFQLNLRAIRQLRALEVEARPATAEETALL